MRPRPDRLSVTAKQPPASFAEELTTGLRSALGSELVAVYLYGSAVSGGFDEGVSDIDLLVVTAQNLNDRDIERIEALHERTVERHPEWDDRLELVYVARETLAHFRGGGIIGVISPGEPFHIRGGVELWLQNFYLVRETGMTLTGPSPITTIPEISWSEFLAATTRYAAEVQGRSLQDATPGARAYGVLTMCRALRTVQSGRPCSKQEGAEWIRAGMPEWAWLIEAAERCRLSRGLVGFADEETISAAEALIEQLGAEITDGI
jgi:predicted nucleotidyltransferase